MKICTKCKVLKGLDEFHRSCKGKLGVQPACKECMNAAYTISRNKKRQHYQEVGYARNRLVTTKIEEYKASKGCTICGEMDPCCIDFHHTDPSKKENAISNMRHCSWDTVLVEVAKCIPLCRNCHAKVHAGKLKL